MVPRKEAPGPSTQLPAAAGNGNSNADGARGLAHSEPAAASASAPAPPSATSPRSMTAATVLLFLCCTSFSFFSDASTKNILRDTLPFPITITVFQLGVSFLLGHLLLSVFKLHKAQPVSASTLQATAPIMVCQAFGFGFTNASFHLVPVSFSHTVKACEVPFIATMSYLFLGERQSLLTYLTLLPMIAGVSLSAMTELSFSLIGFIFAMGANFSFASRSVVSTKVFKKRTLDDINLYRLVCGGATVVALAGAAVLEWPQIYAERATLLSWNLLLQLVMCGTFHYIYNLASFMILSRTSPLTHVVIHTLRRVVVILVCVAYFGNPMTPLNWVGVVVVTVAVLAYTFSKQKPVAKAKPE